MRFDFLRDGLPDALERALALRLPRRLRTAASALAMVLCVLLCAGFVEVGRCGAAAGLERTERLRLDAARARLAAADLELHDVTVLLETQRRLRAVRGSGTRSVLQLAAIGNLVARGVWLGSLASTPTGFDIEGEAVNVGALHATLANFAGAAGIGATHLLRMARLAPSAGRPLVSFSVHVEVSR
jgi:hypothetical protein